MAENYWNWDFAPQKMQFEGLARLQIFGHCLFGSVGRVLTINRMICVFFPLLRIEEDKAWWKTIKNHLHLGVCFQPQPQLIVMLIMMLYEDDNDGAGKQWIQVFVFSGQPQLEPWRLETQGKKGLHISSFNIYYLILTKKEINNAAHTQIFVNQCLAKV